MFFTQQYPGQFLPLAREQLDQGAGVFPLARFDQLQSGKLGLADLDLLDGLDLPKLPQKPANLVEVCSVTGALLHGPKFLLLHQVQLRSTGLDHHAGDLVDREVHYLGAAPAGGGRTLLRVLGEVEPGGAESDHHR